MRTPLLIVLAGISGQRAAGQQPGSLERGAEVRATMTEARGTILGRLIDARSDTLWIQGTDRAVEVVPRASLAGLEVNRRSRATATGALVGGIVGAAGPVHLAVRLPL